MVRTSSAVSCVGVVRGQLDLGTPIPWSRCGCLLRRPALVGGDRTPVGGRTGPHSSESARAHRPAVRLKQSDFMGVAIARAQLQDVLMRSCATPNASTKPV